MHRVSGAPTNSNMGPGLHPADIIRLIRTYVRWWAVPAVVGFVLAGAYSLFASREWRATQALIVRAEAASVSEDRLGKFSDLAEMKTLQETILELAKSQTVMQATLREAGPPRGYSRVDRWPTPLDVESFRGDVDMRPPGGAEFGKTEVFYLSVRNSKRDRASVLVSALCNQVEIRMQELRDQRAQSMIAELERTVAMANGDLTKQISLLSSFESNIGADLAELRSLNADVSGQSQVSQEVQAIETERRANESRRLENQRLLKLLVAAKDDPQQLLATPNSLLLSQPAVSQLKIALVAAQLRTANLLGSRQEAHPYVVAAREAEDSIRRQLNSEVAVAIRGLQVDIELSADHEKSLSAKHDAAHARISRLADGRAEYENLVASVQNHTRLVEAARKNLADARARQAGARSASVISRIDGVEAGVRPIGPSRKIIAAAGGGAGLVFGFGLIFLFANPIGTTSLSDSNGTVAPENAVPVSIPITNDLAQFLNSPPANSPVATHAGSSSLGDSGRVENGAFGLFRGMTLHEAIRAVQKRGN